MVSATQTQPPLRWPHYVCSYINLDNHVLFTDKDTQNNNSGTRNYLCDNVLDAPASATTTKSKPDGLLFVVPKKSFIDVSITTKYPIVRFYP